MENLNFKWFNQTQKLLYNWFMRNENLSRNVYWAQFESSDWQSRLKLCFEPRRQYNCRPVAPPGLGWSMWRNVVAISGRIRTWSFAFASMVRYRVNPYRPADRISSIEFQLASGNAFNTRILKYLTNCVIYKVFRNVLCGFTRIAKLALIIAYKSEKLTAPVLIKTTQSSIYEGYYFQIIRLRT